MAPCNPGREQTNCIHGNSSYPILKTTTHTSTAIITANTTLKAESWYIGSGWEKRVLAACRVDFCRTIFTISVRGYKKNSWRDDERPVELRWETQSWVEVILVKYWINDLKFHLVIANTCTCIFLRIWSSFCLWSCHPVAWAHFYDNSSSFSFSRAKVVWLLRLAKPTKPRKDALQLFRG